MIPTLFIILIMQMILTIISYTNINLKVTDYNCKEEIRNVKGNKIAWRILQTASFVGLLIIFILMQI